MTLALVSPPLSIFSFFIQSGLEGERGTDMVIGGLGAPPPKLELRDEFTRQHLLGVEPREAEQTILLV